MFSEGFYLFVSINISTCQIDLIYIKHEKNLKKLNELLTAICIIYHKIVCILVTDNIPYIRSIIFCRRHCFSFKENSDLDNIFCSCIFKYLNKSSFGH